MFAVRPGERLTDEEVERGLRWAAVECVDPSAIDQGELHSYALGPVDAALAVRLRAHVERCDYCSALLIEYRRIAAEKKKKRSIVLVAASSFVAAAAVAATILFMPQQRPVIRRYALAELHGTMATKMADPSDPANKDIPKEPWRFAPTSPVEIVLAPKEEQASGVVPEVGVFTAEHGGRLTRASGVDVIRGEDAGYPVLKISGGGEEIFGSTPGPRTLLLVLAAQNVFAELAGKTVDEAEKEIAESGPGAQSFAFEVIYER